MVPHKTKRGDTALERLKCFEGIPAPYNIAKRLVVPDALKPLRLQHGHRFCILGDLSASVSARAGTAVRAYGGSCCVSVRELQCWERHRAAWLLQLHGQRGHADEHSP